MSTAKKEEEARKSKEKEEEVAREKLLFEVVGAVATAKTAKEAEKEEVTREKFATKLRFDVVVAVWSTAKKQEEARKRKGKEEEVTREQLLFEVVVAEDSCVETAKEAEKDVAGIDCIVAGYELYLIHCATACSRDLCLVAVHTRCKDLLHGCRDYSCV